MFYVNISISMAILFDRDTNNITVIRRRGNSRIALCENNRWIYGVQYRLPSSLFGGDDALHKLNVVVVNLYEIIKNINKAINKL